MGYSDIFARVIVDIIAKENTPENTLAEILDKCKQEIEFNSVEYMNNRKEHNYSEGM